MHDCAQLRRIIVQLSLVACVLFSTAMTQATDDELVAFNTKSLKFHCLSCEWAQKCTKNCITISRSEAIERGGVPCKVCGGTCKKSAVAAGGNTTEWSCRISVNGTQPVPLEDSGRVVYEPKTVARRAAAVFGR